jgi:acyl-CoA thioester hydrolase
MSHTHTLPIRVYYEDTDAQGIVYHANYLKFTERARTEMLRAAGFDHAAFAETQGAFFVMRKAEIDYLAPARLDDALMVETTVVHIGNASVTLQQNILKNGQIVVESRVVLVCINTDGKPVRVPLEARDAFAALLPADPVAS